MRLAEVEDYVRAVEALLRGETTDIAIEGAPRRTGFLGPVPPVMNIADPIPTHVSAFGPKGRRLVARLGAGWLGSFGSPDSEAAALADMREVWSTKGATRTRCTQRSSAAGRCSMIANRPTAHGQGRRPDPWRRSSSHDLVETSVRAVRRGQLGFPFPDETRRLPQGP